VTFSEKQKDREEKKNINPAGQLSRVEEGFIRKEGRNGTISSINGAICSEGERRKGQHILQKKKAAKDSS